MSPKLQLIKRDSSTIKVTAKDECGAVIDITGYTIYFTVKSLTNISSPDTTATIQKIVTSHTDPEQGITHIALSSSDTNVDAGDYYYDIQIKTPTGAVSSCVSGKIEILQDITASV